MDIPGVVYGVTFLWDLSRYMLLKRTIYHFGLCLRLFLEYEGLCGVPV